MSLEILHRALVLLRGLTGIEGAEIPSPIRPWIDLARIQSILAGFELTDHAASVATDMPGVGRDARLSSNQCRGRRRPCSASRDDYVFASMNACNCDLLRLPTRVATGWPSLKIIRVGMPRTL